MTVVIHAGLKKCGSSSIHAFLSANRTFLRTLKIDYPGPGRPGTHLADEIQVRRKFRDARGTLSRLAEHWTEATEETMVLSSEMLEETEQDQARRIKNAFLASRKAEDFVIVLIIRDLVDLIPSVYAQKAKDNRTGKSFDEFFESIFKERRVDYFATASRWADVFGWESMRIRVLDREQLLNQDLLDDFLSILGVGPATKESLQLKRPGIANAAPGWRVVESVRALSNGAHGLTDGHPLVQAVSQTAWLGGLGRAASILGARNEWNNDRGQYLTSQQAERCLEIHRRAIAALNAHLSHKIPEPLDLVSRGFRERCFMPDSTHIPPADLRAFYDALWTVISENKARRRRRESRKIKRSGRTSTRARLM